MAGGRRLVTLVSHLFVFDHFRGFCASSCLLRERDASRRHTRPSSRRGERPPATRPRRAVQGRCRRTPRWSQRLCHKTTSRQPILSRHGFSSHLERAKMRYPGRATRPRRRVPRSKQWACLAANRAAALPPAKGKTVAPNRLPVQLPRSLYAAFSLGTNRFGSGSPCFLICQRSRRRYASHRAQRSRKDWMAFSGHSQIVRRR